MTFLSRLGQVLNLTTGLVPVLTPIVTTISGKPVPQLQNVNDQLTQVATTIAQIEMIGQALQLPGAKKLELAVPLVTQIVLSSPMLLGKAVNNQALFQAGVGKLASGMADVLNSIDENSVEVIPVVQ